MQQYRQDENVLIIDVENVKPWHKFIDDIASCDFIISSSLHGIIISDAYKVPNIWVEFSGGETKRFAFMIIWHLSVNQILNRFSFLS